jgi:hypothetical protein
MHISQSAFDADCAIIDRICAHSARFTRLHQAASGDCAGLRTPEPRRITQGVARKQLRLANAIALYREPGGGWHAEGSVTVWGNSGVPCSGRSCYLDLMSGNNNS